MSMTREQALKLLEYPIYKWSMDWDEREDGLNYSEAIERAISALRPVSREQVAKLSRCEHCKDGKSFDGQVVIMGNKGMFPLNFCPWCGSPLKDEAVEMVMERLEALKDGDLE